MAVTSQLIYILVKTFLKTRGNSISFGTNINSTGPLFPRLLLFCIYGHVHKYEAGLWTFGKMVNVIGFGPLKSLQSRFKLSQYENSLKKE